MSCSFDRWRNSIPARAKRSLSDLRSTTWEDGDAKKFRFNSENVTGDKAADEVDGHAERDATAVEVNLTKPRGKNFSLPVGAVFPDGAYAPHHYRRP